MNKEDMKWNIVTALVLLGGLIFLLLMTALAAVVAV